MLRHMASFFLGTQLLLPEWQSPSGSPPLLDQDQQTLSLPSLELHAHRQISPPLRTAAAAL